MADEQKDVAATNPVPAHGPSFVEPGDNTLAQVGGAMEPAGEATSGGDSNRNRLLLGVG